MQQFIAMTVVVFLAELGDSQRLDLICLERHSEDAFC